MPDSFNHFVFVDFENVPKVDLGLVAGKAVHVTLLIGKKQTKIDTPLSIQFNKYAGQVTPVEVNASGRNALDMILACYLGQAIQRNPGAQFTIVSKDKDFEPVLGHLAGKDIRIARHDTFAAAFQTAPKKPAPASRLSAPTKTPPVDRLTKLVESFKGRPQHCPKKRTTLLHHIATFYGNTLSETEVAGIVGDLERRGVINIDDKGKVAYR